MLAVGQGVTNLAMPWPKLGNEMSAVDKENRQCI